MAKPVEAEEDRALVVKEVPVEPAAVRLDLARELIDLVVLKRKEEI